MAFSNPSSATPELVLARIVELFRRPRKQPQFVRDDDASNAVFELLLREFPLPAIRACVEWCLHETASIDWQGAVPTEPQRKATQCCLLLTRDVAALALSTESLAVLVYKMNSIGGYFHLGPQVGRQLDEAQLVDALTLGVQTAPEAFQRASCLAGLRLYYRRVKRRSDTETFERSLQAFEREVRRLRTRDAECLGTVDDARSMVWIIRGNRPELPKPAASSYVAYRDEQAETTSYIIERRDDHELAIAIPRCEVVDETLFIDFECFDPQLLPVDAPLVIGVTLLQGYAQGTHLRRVTEIVFFDIRDKQTRRQAVARARQPP